MGKSKTDSEWTPEDQQRLFTAMEKNISIHGRSNSDFKGLTDIKWARVAFPPFSALECKRKWMDIFRTLQKMQSLPELIAEAENRLLNQRHMEAKGICGEPKFPARTDKLVFFKKWMNRLKKKIPVWQERFSKVCQMWADLPKSQKSMYTMICDAGKLKYKNELRQWFKMCTPKFQTMYLERKPTKRKYLGKVNCQQQQETLFLPSDSEDEDIICSSDEDDDVLESEKDEECEEQEESFIFERY